MKFVIVDPFETKVELIDVPDISYAYAQTGLDTPSAFGVDHGMVTHHIAIVVDGASLLLPPHTQRYFQIGYSLYAGRAVIYGVDGAGETIDMPEKPSVCFFASPDEVERAINKGQVHRPRTCVNDVCLWEWKPDAT